MIVKIEDDFSLEKIVESGQCFRPKKLSDESYFFITGNHFLKIRELAKNKYEVSCREEDWQRVWVNYFDLKRNYQKIRREYSGINSYVDDAMEYSRGIRILRQDKWEMLISYIISQRKNIPAIRKSVEFLAEKFGSSIRDCEVNAFATAKELEVATDEDLKGAALGYRLEFVKSAISRIARNENFLDELDKLDDEKIVEELKHFHGIGNKVANCVALFAYSRTSLAPVDVWIQKAIDLRFGGENIFSRYNSVAGIIQQYVFFYERHISR